MGALLLKNILLDTAQQGVNEKEGADRALEDGAQGDSERQRDWKDAHLAIMRCALKIVLEEADPRMREVFILPSPSATSPVDRRNLS